MSKLTKVGITQGDHNGIGPEVTLKALSDETILEIMTPVLFADWRVIDRAVKQFGLEMPTLVKVASAADARDGAINVVDLAIDKLKIEPGQPTAESGRAAVASLRGAMAALKGGEVDVLVTAPICKEAVQNDDFHFAGHTEYLGAEAGADYTPRMILFDDHVRVALVTTHLPLAEIPAAITREKVAAAITDFSRTLKEDFNAERPKIAVLSLNPHCGDGGLLGHEEEETIAPAIADCEEKGVLAFGPYAADGFFGTGAYKHFDGVLAMYHDQGLAPFKTIAGELGVNYTGGLPFIRTSPDHGTAFDIAWKGEADPASMREAIYKAIDLRRNRQRYRKSAANPLRRQNPERQPKPERQPRGNSIKDTAPGRTERTQLPAVIQQSDSEKEQS